MLSEWKAEDEMLESLVSAVPKILASQKPNGQFGTEPWIVTDQNLLLALAAAWRLPDSPHHHSDDLLQAIVRGGDALIDAQDEAGMWIFRKKDNSTWGPIYQPWTYSRWIRAYQLTREAMSADVRARWDEALLLGFDGIARTAMRHYHNIPTHHAMALYCAGEVFGRDDWRAQSREFIGTMLQRQCEHGWWSEHFGPVVSYNFVYSEALGVYYSMSGDERVPPALARAARFHANYTYPDGSVVETVDERNPYSGSLRLGNVGFTHTPVGRGYLARQHAMHLKTGRPFPADYAANMLLHGGSGPVEPLAADRQSHAHRMGGESLVVRRGPWFFSISAYVCEVSEARWIQDRQNFLSVFHDRTGLIVGGGNTKLQPLWSTFTVGDVSLMKHTPGDEDPDFRPRIDLLHIPDKAGIGDDDDSPALTLHYGPEVCTVRLSPQTDDDEVKLIYEATCNSGKPVEAHVTLLPHMDEPLRFASGDAVELADEPIERASRDQGDWIEHAGWRLSLPRGAGLIWPVLPHNPYRKGGEATVAEARIVVTLPFCPSVGRYELALRIL